MGPYRQFGQKGHYEQNGTLWTKWDKIVIMDKMGLIGTKWEHIDKVGQYGQNGTLWTK